MSVGGASQADRMRVAYVETAGVSDAVDFQGVDAPEDRLIHGITLGVSGLGFEEEFEATIEGFVGSYPEPSPSSAIAAEQLWVQWWFARETDATNGIGYSTPMTEAIMFPAPYEWNQDVTYQVRCSESSGAGDGVQGFSAVFYERV